MADIVTEMSSEHFLKKVDSVAQSFSETMSLVDKRKALLPTIFKAHISVMEKHGFVGEKGYIQAQKAIMDYYHDPLIAQGSTSAQLLLFKRAKLY